MNSRTKNSVLIYSICTAVLSFLNANNLDAQIVSRQKIDSEKSLPSDQPTAFLRVINDAAGEPMAMQTALTRYRPKTGDLVVDLIGAVHIGETDYYAQLNQQFENYDVVLYELVAPRGTRIPRGGKKASQGALDIVSWIQSQAKSSLGLESQLEKIDYQKKNLMHADMSPTEMGNKMAERGDTALTIGLSAMAEILRQQNQQSDSSNSSAQQQLAQQLSSESLFELMSDPLKLKRMMANQFAASGVMDMGLGASLNQLLIDDRNEAAMKVLQQEIAAGNKKIAIFYGAAHMPDFEKRITGNLGMTKTKQAWIDAWDLSRTKTTQQTDPAMDLLMGLLNELSK